MESGRRLKNEGFLQQGGGLVFALSDPSGKKGDNVRPEITRTRKMIRGELKGDAGCEPIADDGKYRYSATYAVEAPHGCE